MLEKMLNRIMMGAKTPEGKAGAILLTVALAFMVWDTRMMESAFAVQSVSTTAQSGASASSNASQDVEASSGEVVAPAGGAAGEKAAAKDAAADSAASDADAAAAGAEGSASAADEATTSASADAGDSSGDEAVSEVASDDAVASDGAAATDNEESDPAQPATAAEGSSDEATADNGENEDADTSKQESSSATADEASDANESEVDKASSEGEEAADDAADEAADESDKDANDESDDEQATEDASPAVTLTGSVAGMAVELAAPEGALPKGVQMQLADAATAALSDQVAAETGKTVNTLKAFSIALTAKGGAAAQPAAEVTVTVRDAQLQGDSVAVFRVEDSGALTAIAPLQASANTQSFNARELKPFVVAGVSEAAADEQAVDADNATEGDGDEGEEASEDDDEADRAAAAEGEDAAADEAEGSEAVEEDNEIAASANDAVAPDWPERTVASASVSSLETTE